MENIEYLPSISSLGFLGFHINMAMEKGKINNISFVEVYEAVENGDILDLLEKKIPNFFDFSLFKKGSTERKELNYILCYVSEGTRNREQRKLGISDSGLCLIQAWVIEALQQKFWR